MNEYENQNLLSLYLVSFLVGLRTYQHSCTYSECVRSPSYPAYKSHAPYCHLWLSGFSISSHVI